MSRRRGLLLATFLAAAAAPSSTAAIGEVVTSGDTARSVATAEATTLRDTVPSMGDMPGMKMSPGDTTRMTATTSAQSLNLPMTRDGSGTAWQPDASSMYGWMRVVHAWTVMVHGEVFPRYTKQDVFDQGTRGGEKWDAPNWIMGMAQRRIGQKGLLDVNLMMSLDALTEGGAGYPLLFQNGETWHQTPLVDHQHPHDLFSELSVSYARALSRRSDIYLYIGYPGEPALGPVAFMHRASAFYDPDAPLSHHWQDATHITFGVATIGYRLDKWKLEASVFNGREPDENRYNFDKPRFDSYSARLSYNPSTHYSLQISGAYLKSPEAYAPALNVYRSTASVLAAYPLTHDRSLDASLVWGMNYSTPAYYPGLNSVLMEAAYRVRTWAWYTRYEWVQKTMEDLEVNPAEFNTQDFFGIQALTLGLSKTLTQVGPARLAIGGQVSMNRPDQRLAPVYGSFPIGAEVVLRIYPGAMHMLHST